MKFIFLCLAIIGSCSAAFGPDVQTAIVKAHNDLRSEIAKGKYAAKGKLVPAATDMMKMSWDDTIAKSAQAFADKCPKTHLKEKKPYGENLYSAATSGALGDIDLFGTKATKAWEKEFQKYGWTSRTYDENTKKLGIGHATQMVWSESNKIGCGVKNCGANPKGMNKVTVVCQYSAKGNIRNHKIYTEGTTCSKCPSGTNCDKNTGLCA